MRSQRDFFDEEKQELWPFPPNFSEFCMFLFLNTRSFFILSQSSSSLKCRKIACASFFLVRKRKNEAEISSMVIAILKT